eukprot:gene28892-34866_t
MLSFEEFKAVRNREALANQPPPTTKKVDTANAKQSKDFEPEPQPSNAKNSAQIPKKSTWRQSLGDFLELNQTQNIYLVVVLLDTFAAFAAVYLTPQGRNLPSILQRPLSILQGFTTFSSAFYLIELVLSIIAFGFVLLGHWGYLLDILVTGAQIAWEYVGVGPETRLLNVFRVWRLLRLLFALLNAERENALKLQEQLEAKELAVSELTLKIQDLSGEMKNEKDARKSVEQMLLNYKEEVDTLNEALRIAAMDIAEVGQDDDMGSEGDMYSIYSSEDGDAADKGDIVIESKDSQSVASSRKAEKLSAVMGKAAAGKEDKAPMFIIKEDGTFSTS